MTEKVNPSEFRPAEAFKTAGAIANGGASDGWIVDGASPTELSVQDGGIADGNLNTFAQTSSASSFDVTIDAGEAFVYGAWTVIDTSTTVTLSASTNGQTVYVGWNKDGTNDTIVGLQSAFDNASGNTDKKIPLYDFDTDGSGVTSVTDRRTIGQSITATKLSMLQSIDGGTTLFIDENEGPSVGGPFTVDGTLDIDGSFVSGGPIYGSGSITGTGTVASSGAISDSIEPIAPTIDGSTFVAIAGWTTDNDDGSYDAYRFGKDAGIAIEQDGGLTIEQ